MRRVLLSLIPSGLLGMAAGVVALTDSWGRVGVPLGDQNFGDLNVILVAAQCANQDLTWSASDPPCQPNMSHYNYPSLWAQVFGMVNGNPTWTPYIATFIAVVLLLSLIPLTWLAIGKRASVAPMIFMTVAALTPPVWLALQRANIDVLMFGLITLAVVAWMRSHVRTGGFLVGVAATLKIFPLGASLMLLLPKRNQRAGLITLGITTLVGFLAIARDLTTISSRTPQIDGASFGVGLLPLLASNRFDLDLSITAVRLIGFVLFLIVFTALMLGAHRFSTSRPVRMWNALMSDLVERPNASAALLAGAGTFLAGYILGPSYDYRLIFLILIISALLSLQSRTGAIAAAILILQMILSYSTFVGAAEYLSDLMLLVVAPLLTLGAVQVIRKSRV